MLISAARVLMSLRELFHGLTSRGFVAIERELAQLNDHAKNLPGDRRRVSKLAHRKRFASSR